MGVEASNLPKRSTPTNVPEGVSISDAQLYRHLGRKLDGLSTRLPWNDALHQLLRALFSSVEAQLFINMPYGPSTRETLSKITQIEESYLMPLLDGLCSKGLVMDLWINGTYHYVPSPVVTGAHELFRAWDMIDLNSGNSPRLLHQYLDTSLYYKANASPEMQVSVFRTLPHEDALGRSTQSSEYERASWIVDSAEKCAVGPCSFSNVQSPTNSNKCHALLEACVSFDYVAEYQIRRNLARFVSKAELKEMLASSKENGLMFVAENVRQRVSFLCQCCSCCCFLLNGIKRHGLSTSALASGYVARVEEKNCNGCGRCVDACPINIINMVPLYLGPQKIYGETIAAIDTHKCLGCGVCATLCPTSAISLEQHNKKVIRPATTFQRIVLQCLERGTLQNQLFDNPENLAHRGLRYVVGTFLKFPPVNRALMSMAIRAPFLTAIEAAFTAANKDELQLI